MTAYADTNFFTRFYLELPGSEAALALFHEAEGRDFRPLPITWLHRLELCNALQLHVFQGRLPRHKRVTVEQAASAWATFRSEVGKGGLFARGRD